MKKNIVKFLIAAGVVAVVGVGATVATVNAEPVDGVAITEETLVQLEADGLTLEEMLTAAIQDEWLALAEYQAIIATYGAVRPFTNIIAAEETHASLLLPLFEAYGITVPENLAASQVVLPDSITSALATGVAAEEANIAMYELFLSQEGLPEDVANVFTLLKDASLKHLNAFSKDRYACVGQDLASKIQNAFGKGGKYGKGTGDGTGSQNAFGGNRGTSGTYAGTRGNGGVCPNL